MYDVVDENFLKAIVYFSDDFHYSRLSFFLAIVCVSVPSHPFFHNSEKKIFERIYRSSGAASAHLNAETASVIVGYILQRTVSNLHIK